MSDRLRRILAVMAATLMFSTTFASTATAETTVDLGDASFAPIAVDVLVLRPVGLVSLLVDTMLFAIAEPIVLITRPHEIGKPFKQLVIRPVKYIWADPLGGH